MICVTICTRERPKMLHRLLTSCAKIESDHRSKIAFIVIENGEAAGAYSVVDEFQPQLDISYVNEKNLGIVNARNTAVEIFLASGATWMGSFDDDGIVSPGWLVAMLDAIDSYPECRVFAGPQIRIPPKNASIWFPHRESKFIDTGTKNWNVSTANILFQRNIFAKDGLQAKFDPRFNLSGGEDTQLFYTLKDLGEDILWVSEAECIEPTIDARGTFRAKSERIIVRAQNWGNIVLLRFGRLTGGLLVFWYLFASILNVFSLAIFGTFVLIFSETKGIEVLSRALQSGFQAIGYFKSLFLKNGEYYANTDGH